MHSVLGVQLLHVVDVPDMPVVVQSLTNDPWFRWIIVVELLDLGEVLPETAPALIRHLCSCRLPYWPELIRAIDAESLAAVWTAVNSLAGLLHKEACVALGRPLPVLEQLLHATCFSALKLRKCSDGLGVAAHAVRLIWPGSLNAKLRKESLLTCP